MRKMRKTEKTLKVIIQRSEQKHTQKTDPTQTFVVAIRVAMQSFLLCFAHFF
jgi:hypothetical protein